MTLSEYQRLAMRTSLNNHNRIQNGIMGLIGESGEVVDVVKKWMFQSTMDTPLPVKRLVEEIGDVLWYCAEYCTGNHMVLADELQQYNGICTDLDELAIALAEEAVCRHIGSVLRICTVILECYCGTTLEAAMEQNIEKLWQRYPDGFDAARSENR